LQITKDSSELSRTKKLARRYANMLVIWVTLTYMLVIAVGVPISIIPDIKTLLIVPRVEDHTLLKWLMSAYLATAFCLEWFLYGVIQRARARIKLYEVD
jgi:hypothetical protein